MVFCAKDLKECGDLADFREMNMELLATPNVKPHYITESACLQLTVLGDLKSTTVKVLHAEISSVIRHEYAFSLRVDVLELDISAAGIVDSLGLNLVLTLVKWATGNGAEIHIVVGARSVHDTLSAIGLERHAKFIYRD